MGAGVSRNAKQSIQQGEVHPSAAEVSPNNAAVQITESLRIKNDYLKKTTNTSESKSNTNKFNHLESDQDDDDDIDSTSVQMTDRELEDLESSLMEIPSLKGASPRKNLEPKVKNKKDCFRDENISILSSPPNTRGHPPQPNSFYEFARKRPKRTGDVRRTSSLGRSNQFTSSNRRPYQRSVEDTQRLRFSWDERKTNSATAVPSLEMDRNDEDEWTYTKTVIDGFDVAKFKKVNSKVDPSSFIEKHNNGRKTFMDTTQMPGVPTYDTMEQQLLASLEREIL